MPHSIEAKKHRSYSPKYLFDGEAGVKIITIKNFSIVGSWRVLSFTGKDDDDFVKLRISGPFLGATIKVLRR